ncbi:hypothetical protein PCH_Pc12g06660 [Penicillium rubens Wisconsin 54-1255]|uniref:Uncharacterized protein n=1 Tax=Penicillium rubens (strain ATCC 28089 / DSM 1075 / NRRL 1951 / Wisconsin 54-1255) TaxID=500485 RepID=B6H0G0_PENRW|nr:hypothetical protein PCH_Pc12g06660 [Penicillium rubens Wisconsin 54-1255]
MSTTYVGSDAYPAVKHPHVDTEVPISLGENSGFFPNGTAPLSHEWRRETRAGSKIVTPYGVRIGDLLQDSSEMQVQMKVTSGLPYPAYTQLVVTVSKWIYNNPPTKPNTARQRVQPIKQREFGRKQDLTQ